MKKLIAILIVLMFAFVPTAFAEGGGGSVGDDFGEAYTTKDEPDQGGECPITNIKGKVAACKSCHTLIENDGKVIWGLKEITPFSAFSPPNGAVFKIIDGETVGWYDFDYVEDLQVRNVIEYFYRHKIKRIIFNVDSYGGSAFDGYSISNLFDQYEGKIVIETRLQSQAMSAGFLVLVAGHRGHRYVSPMATLMWHEIAYWAFLKKITPSSSEQEAAVMRMLQDVANEFLASRSNMTKEKIDSEIANKDWFFNGKQAVEMGFADELIE